MKKENNSFSDRYKALIKDEDFATKITYEMSSEIYNVLGKFDEPILLQPNRYDNWTENSCASTEVYAKFFKKKGLDYKYAKEVDLEWLCNLEYNEWFDIIELWAEELSTGERAEFQEAINEVFFDFDQPWFLVQGHIIKIDSKQFEQDLIRKAMASLDFRIDNAPVFQSAIDEYVRAVEFFDKREYKDCILYAEKSYESTLKIICGQTDGQADGLTKSLIKSHYVDDFPKQINQEGLRISVLMSLPYLRNQLKVGHGEGEESILITPALAKLVLNLSASLNSFIVEQYVSHLPSPI